MGTRCKQSRKVKKQKIERLEKKNSRKA